jgi:hypothetical protein
VRPLTVAFGRSHLSIVTEQVAMEWPALAKLLTAMPPEVTDKASRGWYIPAEFNPAYRDSENFVARHAITYDFDHVNIDTWGNALLKWSGLAFAMYTTYSHRADRPRFRIVMPLSRPAGYDEFQAVARMVATDIGIELVARESFVPAQMMYMPTRTLGGLFTSLVNDGDWLDVDKVLAEDYNGDWTNTKLWPHRRDGDSVHAIKDQMVPPLEKPGLVGDVNRAYRISEAIELLNLPYRRVR